MVPVLAWLNDWCKNRDVVARILVVCDVLQNYFYVLNYQLFPFSDNSDQMLKRAWDYLLIFSKVSHVDSPDFDLFHNNLSLYSWSLLKDDDKRWFLKNTSRTYPKDSSQPIRIGRLTPSGRAAAAAS